MRAVHSWLREMLPGLPDAHACADALTDAGLKVESVELLGAGDASISGVVVGEVVTIEELTEFKKPIRFVEVRTSEDGPLKGIVCGATNFAAGDRVPVALPGAVLPGGFAIGQRETYGRISDGMICSARELGLGDDHRGIMVLPSDTPLGGDVAEQIGWPDAVLDIEVTTDRGYALSHRGIARELATAFGLDFRDPADLALPDPLGPAAEVRIENLHDCSHYVLRRMHGESLVKAASSSLADQARLIAAGMRPISRIVDVTNLVLLGVGQPLHAFDADKLQGAVAVRRAKPGERLETLDGVDRALSPEDLVIADDLGPVALAGVMGGARTEISETTTEVALESARFDSMLTTRTSRRHGLASEASRRFERGVDPELARYGAELAARMLLGESAGDSVHLTEVGTPLQLPPVLLPAGECERLGGRVYPVQTITLRLEQVGCAVTPGDPLVVQPPPWRPDLTRAADLVEEVLRLEGYRTIPVTLPRAPAGRGLTAGQRTRRRVTAAVADAGFGEVLLLPFSSKLGERQHSRMKADDRRRRQVRVANPLSEDEAYLRTTLLPGLLSAAARNVSRGNADVALFEVGTVFFAREQPEPVTIPPVSRRPTPDELLALEALLPEQPMHIGAVLTGQRVLAGPLQPARAADWADAVQLAHVIAAAAGTVLDVEAGDRDPWHPGRCAALSVAGPEGRRLIGFAGELHPSVVAESELPPRACALELDLGALIGASDPPPVLAPLSPYPAADRDVALLVPSGVNAGAVEAALRAAAGGELEALRLFDDFTNADGERSLAYRLRWRAGRTLTAEEVNALRDAAVAEAAARTGARLRT